MALVRLNNQLIQELMKQKLMRPIDLAKTLGISRQLVNHVIYHGGMKYVARLAVLFDCKVSDLLIGVVRTLRLPAGTTMVDGKVRRIKERRER